MENGENIRIGVLLKVRDLDASRWFYREILKLGEPVIDSTFAVEFESAPRLRLEKSAASYLDPATSPLVLTVDADNPAQLLERLERADIPFEEFNRPGGRFLRCLDPDGNSILIAAPAAPATGR